MREAIERLFDKHGKTTDQPAELSCTITQQMSIVGSPGATTFGNISASGDVHIHLHTDRSANVPGAPVSPVQQLQSKKSPPTENTEPDDNLVFISYSHNDEVWKDRLRPHLRMHEQNGRLRIWDDRNIDAGAEWYEEIRAVVSRVRVAICLISADFLASDFVNKEEIPELLRRRSQDGLLVIPVLIRQCDFEGVDWLRRIQMLPRDAKPVADFGGNWDQPFSEVAKAVRLALESTKQANIPKTQVAPAVPVKWPRLDEKYIVAENLPVTGAELFGRHDELKLLNEAWKKGDLNVLTFVAYGGVGKSTLVRRWLGNMALDNYRGAERVLTWTFYSQGTSERATCADRFIDFALRWYGDPNPESGSAWTKGERLAQLIQQHRTLLILDGLEPLQDRFTGRIKDNALAILLERLAKRNPGLVVITTREHINNLDRFNATAIEQNMEQISAEAGRSLLRVRGVRGTDAQLERATRDFGNHALAINLLATYLYDTPGHRIENAASIPTIDVSDPRSLHPRRVMAAWENRLGEGPEINVLRILGLFDRPATQAEINAVLEGESIQGLTNHLHGSDQAGIALVLHRLRTIGLILPQSAHALDEVDAHPLVREHFGERLHAENEDAWKAGHSRLFDYLIGPGCKKEYPDTLEEMAPLYASIPHGYKAGREWEANHLVFFQRIRRRNEQYSTKVLGAHGSDLTALASFFDEPWSRPSAAFDKPDQSLLLNEAAYCVRASGRFGESIAPMRAALEASRSFVDSDDAKQHYHWTNAARAASSLSELLLALGRIDDAIEMAQQSIEHAHESGNAPQLMLCGTTHADALHQAGRMNESQSLFEEAEVIQKATQPTFPLLYSLRGFQYCDLLLSKLEQTEDKECILSGAETLRKRATTTLQWAAQQEWLLDIALDHLNIGRASLLIWQSSGESSFTRAFAQIDTAVDKLRDAGAIHHIPRGLLARAALYRNVVEHGDTTSIPDAEQDLDEAIDIATRDAANGGTLKLFLCDAHLEYARLRLAQNKPEQARSHFDEAVKLVNECGYHRRDREVAALRERLNP